MVIVPPDALKGPMLPAGVGSVSVMPFAGTGDGRGTSKLIVPVEICAGVAPLASIDPVALPLRSVSPKAAAAEAMPEGTSRVVW